jgi:hypothetical protein
MFNTLYEYLVLHKQLSLPGVGTLHLQRISSQLDYGHKMISAPRYTFYIDTASDKPSKNLFEWLSAAKGISEWDAIRMVNDFSFELKKNISAAREVHWKNVGIISRNETGSITLVPEEIILEQPVIAEKVTREHAAHTVLVGDMEKSSVEMDEIFQETQGKKDVGWIIAILLTVAALMFTGWYFSEKGLKPAATGNQTLIVRE